MINIQCKGATIRSDYIGVLINLRDVDTMYIAALRQVTGDPGGGCPRCPRCGAAWIAGLLPTVWIGRKKKDAAPEHRLLCEGCALALRHDVEGVLPAIYPDVEIQKVRCRQFDWEIDDGPVPDARNERPPQ
jgi:hypothetical protein